MYMHAHMFFEISALILYIYLYSKLKIEFKYTKYQIIGSIEFCLPSEIINKYHTIILMQ